MALGARLVPLLQRSVRLALLQVLLDTRMTPEADRRLAILQFRRVALVATPALATGKRPVRAPARHRGLEIPMRVMAPKTVGSLDREPPVAGQERGTLDVVTTCTELRHRTLEHSVIGRAMRIMAAVTPALGDRLVSRSLLNDLADVFVAAQAELTLGFLEKRRLIRAVPRMAVVASPLPHGRMGQSGDRIQIAERMAGLASLADASGQKMIALCSVRVVADGAFA